jgi:nucleoside-diphosphate-sugar epimerase
MSRVAIIGSNGFVGSALARFLQEKNFNIVKILRSNQIYQDNPVEMIINCSSGKNSKINDLWEIENLVSRIKPMIKAETLLIDLGSYIQYCNVRDNSLNSEYLNEKNILNSKLKELSSQIGNDYLLLSLFTVYGQYQNDKSIVSKLLESFLKKESIKLSAGYQLISLTHISDLCSAIYDIYSHRTKFSESSYSFWQTPPSSLRHVVHTFNQTLPSPLKVNWGSLDYKGHEIFSYESSLYPRQLYESYKWVNLGDGITSMLSDIR